MVTENTVGWSIIKEDDEASLGHQTKQVHIISITKSKPVFKKDLQKHKPNNFTVNTILYFIVGNDFLMFTAGLCYRELQK